MTEALNSVVDEAMIERLVRQFYVRVRADSILGPIFEDVLPDDWEPHLQNMMAFWSSVLLMSGRFKGQPVVKHQALTTVRPEHFTHWLALFSETADDIFPPETAAYIVGRAEHIGDSLKRAMFETNTPRAPSQAA